MTNYEFYKEELKNIRNGDLEDGHSVELCDFLQKHIYDGECTVNSCNICNNLFTLWLLDEHEEQETDWSKVEVDTPILVRNNEDEEWSKYHFARYENGKVWTYDNGKTSWSWSKKYLVLAWNYAKLAEVEK